MDKKSSNINLFNFQNKDEPEDIFTLLYPIGKRKDSIIYKAIHKTSRQTFAIKIISNITDNNKLIFFQNKIKLMKKLFNKCEYIIKIYDSYYSKISKSLWVISEYCPLGSVMDFLIAMNRPYNEIEVATIISMILKGLIHLYNNNIIFSNYKSSDILITEDGYSKLNLINFKKIKNKDEHKIDIFCLGAICIELITGVQINNILQRKKILYNFFHNNINIKKYSQNLFSFLNKCLTNEIDKKPNICELLNHPFIINNSKDKEYLRKIVIKYTGRKEFKNINYKKIKKGEDNFYIGKNINNNINNFFLTDNNTYNKYLYKNNINNSGLLKLKDYIIKKTHRKKYKYNPNQKFNNYNNNYIYNIKGFSLNNSIKNKNKILKNSKPLMKNENIFTKGIYLNSDSCPNFGLKNKLLTGIELSNHKMNSFTDKNNMNYINDLYNINNLKNNEEKLKCEIIKLTPNIKKNCKKINEFNIQNNEFEIKRKILFGPEITFKNNSPIIENNIKNNIDNMISFTFGENINKDILSIKDKQNTFYMPIINNFKKISYRPVSIDTYKINRKIMYNKCQKNKINTQLLNEGDDSKNYENINNQSFDDIIENDDNFYSYLDFESIEIINKASKNKKMNKSHVKYFH